LTNLPIYLAQFDKFTAELIIITIQHLLKIARQNRRNLFLQYEKKKKQQQLFFSVAFNRMNNNPNQQAQRQSRRQMGLPPVDYVSVLSNGPSIQDTNTSYQTHYASNSTIRSNPSSNRSTVPPSNIVSHVPPVSSYQHPYPYATMTYVETPRYDQHNHNQHTSIAHVSSASWSQYSHRQNELTNA